MKLFTVNSLEVSVSTTYVLLSLIWLFSGQFAQFAIMLAVILIHEAAHGLCARLLGFSVSSVELFPFGGSLLIAGIDSFPAQSIIVSLAGPMVSLFFGFVASKLAIPYDFARYSFTVAFINLLPVYPLDGGRVLDSVLYLIIGKKSKKTSKLISYLTVFGFTGFSVYRIFMYKDFSYTITSLFMLICVLKKEPNGIRLDKIKSKPLACNVKFARATLGEAALPKLIQTQSADYTLFAVTDESGRFLHFTDETELCDAVLKDSAAKIK